MITCANCRTDNRDTARFCMKCSLRLPGTVLQGRYKVSGILGQGGMGAVYLVEDQSLQDRAKRYQSVAEMKRNLLPGAAKPPVVAPAGMGIVGPDDLKWSKMGPMRALTVYCSVDKRETTARALASVAVNSACLSSQMI